MEIIKFLLNKKNKNLIEQLSADLLFGISDNKFKKKKYMNYQNYIPNNYYKII